MRIANYMKNSFIDYPGKICTIVFTAGCNMNCWYCHNNQLLDGQYPDKTEEVLEFLKTRVGKIDAVTISGGEPTLQKNIKEFIKKVKAMGFLVKLDTNGLNPKVLEMLLKDNLLDYVAMDVKAPFNKYESIVRVPIDFSKLQASIDLLKQSKINYEFRTTFSPDLTLDDIEEIGKIVEGAKNFSLQVYRSENVKQDNIIMLPHKPSVINKGFIIIKKYVKNAKLKGL